MKNTTRHRWPALQTCLTGVLLLLGINGYHPCSQDGGIYLPIIMRFTNTRMFESDQMFVAGHSRLSLFASVCSAWVRASHLQFFHAVFALYLLCALAFVCGVRSLALRLTQSYADAGIVGIYASVFFCLPAAGTSLLLMDPYLTARSITTPLTLFVIVAVLDRKYLRAALLSALCTLFHPLMGLYCAFTALVLALTQERKKRALVAFLSFSCAASCVASQLQKIEITAYQEALSTRPYLWLSGWAWFELLGLVLPIALLLYSRINMSAESRARDLCETCLIVGVFSMSVSAALVRGGGSSLLLRLQPLRLVHTIYLLGLILLAVWALQYVNSTPRLVKYFAMPALFAGLMLLANKASYPQGQRFEISPQDYRAGSIGEAFYWITQNTPAASLFSADQKVWKLADPEEDGFRSATGRSILLDDKDEGLVTIFPELTQEWERRDRAQAGLALASDEERRKQLSAYGAQYVLLLPSDPTELFCPFRNASVAVCKL